MVTIQAWKEKLWIWETILYICGWIQCQKNLKWLLLLLGLHKNNMWNHWILIVYIQMKYKLNCVITHYRQNQWSLLRRRNLNLFWFFGRPADWCLATNFTIDLYNLFTSRDWCNYYTRKWLTLIKFSVRWGSK